VQPRKKKNYSCKDGVLDFVEKGEA